MVVSRMPALLLVAALAALQLLAAQKATAQMHESLQEPQVAKVVAQDSLLSAGSSPPRRFQPVLNAFGDADHDELPAHLQPKQLAGAQPIPVPHSAKLEQIYDQRAAVESIMHQHSSGEQLQRHMVMLDQLTGNMGTFARQVVDNAVPHALFLLAAVAKEADVLQLDLDMVPSNGGRDSQKPVGTLTVHQGKGGADAQLELEFLASDEDTKRLLGAAADLLGGRPQSRGMPSRDAVAQGVEKLIDAMGARMHELVSQGRTQTLALAAMRREGTLPQDPVAAHSADQLAQVQVQAGAGAHGACLIALIAMVVMIVSGVMLVSALGVLVCSLRGSRSRVGLQFLCREDMGIPAGAIVCAADEEVPGFAAHEGIPYAPLSGQPETPSHYQKR